MKGGIYKFVFGIIFVIRDCF